jgi:DNA-binding transcriptional LysR family regulator
MERSLQQFLAVAETGSISAAARQVNVTQPTVTANIRNLEEKHSVALFERTPRGMILTPYGSILLEKVRIMSRLEAQAARDIESLRLGGRQMLALGCGHAWWSLFVRDAVEQTLASDTNASVYIENGSNLHCMWKLLSGEIMVSVGHRVDNLAPGIAVEFEPLFKVKDAVFVAAGHPLLERQCTHRDLAGLSQVHSDPVDAQFRHILTLEARNGVLHSSRSKAPQAYFSNSLLTCIDLVKRTGGYTVYPSDMASGLAAQGLAELPLPTVDPPKEIGFYTLSEQQRDPILRVTLDHLRGCAVRYARHRV